MFAEAVTVHGRVRGLDLGPVRVFKGIPYGAPTGGVNRFQPPRPAAAWTGVRDCLGVGQASPQGPVDPRYGFASLLQFNLASQLGGMGEDVLHLNLWTPAVDDGAKRPVMVSLHGGGFANGSGDLPLYDGAQLALKGDVVVVAVTHRLNVFGFLDLYGAGAGEAFSASGVAGMLDLVAALEWVRDNAAAFGGDPDNVTIFGQSGGGWKVSVLLAMAGASGLFHKAIIQSGSRNHLLTPEEGSAIARRFLDLLQIQPNDASALRALPWHTLIEAALKLGTHLFEPVLSRPYLPAHPLDAGAAGQSGDIPVMISTTLDDASFLSVSFGMTETELAAALSAKYGDAGADMLSLYRRRWPDKTPFMLLGHISTDAGFRRFAHTQADVRAASANAATFVYQWNYPCPAFGGLYGATHGIDVAAMFQNLHDPMLGAGDAKVVAPSLQLSSAIVAFARTGSPNGEGLPEWPRFDLARRATLVIDETSAMVSDPEGEIRMWWRDMPLATSVLG